MSRVSAVADRRYSATGLSADFPVLGARFAIKFVSEKLDDTANSVRSTGVAHLADARL